MRYKVNMMIRPRPTVYILYRVKNSLCENCTARVEWPRLRKQPNQYPYVLSPKMLQTFLISIQLEVPIKDPDRNTEKNIFTKISRYMAVFFPEVQKQYEVRWTKEESFWSLQNNAHSEYVWEKKGSFMNERRSWDKYYKNQWSRNEDEWFHHKNQRRKKASDGHNPVNIRSEEVSNY